MSAQLKVELLLAAIDKVTAPLDAMKVAGKKLSTELGEARRALKGLEGARLKINDLQHTNVELKQLKDKLAAAAGSAERAQQALINAEKPTTKLKIAAREAARAHRELIEQESALIAKQSRLSASLKEAGIDTGKLGKEEQSLKAKITATTQSIDAQTKALERHAQRANDAKRINEAASKMQGYSSAMKSAGTQAVITGGVMAAGLSQPIKAFADAEDAATELKVSMMNASGTVAPEFEKISALATELGNRLPGTTADFQTMMTVLKQNGIESQSILDGVGKSTAHLAVALKMPFDEAAQFAARMATATDVANDKMLDFMDSIAKTRNVGVQVEEMKMAFGRSGGKLKELGIQGLEASQKMSVLYAMLIKTGLSGETVGTGFSSMLGAVQDYTYGLTKGGIAAKQMLDGKGIKLDLLDKNGKLKDVRSMIGEFQKLNTLDAETKATVMNSLVGKGQDAQMLSTLIEGGTAAYDAMNKKMQEQADLNTKVEQQLGTLKNAWDAATGTAMNALAGFGEAMGGDLKGLADKMGKLSERTGAWMKDHPTMTKWIGRTVLALTGLSLAFGATALAAGFILNPFAKVWKAYQLFGDFKAGGGVIKIATKLKDIGGVAGRLAGPLSRLGGVLSSSLLKALPTLRMTGVWIYRIFGGPIYTRLFQIIGAGLLKAGSAALRFAGTLAKVAGWASRLPGISHIIGLINTVLLKSIGLVVRLGTSLFRFIQIFRAIGIAAMTNPLFLAIALIAGAAFLIWKNWDKLKAKFMSFSPAVRGALYLLFWPITLLALGAKKIMDNWDKIKPKMLKLWGSIKSIIANVWDAIKGKIKSAWDSILRTLDSMGLKAVANMLRAGANIVQGLWDGIQNKWGAFKDWLSGMAAGIAKTVENALGIKSPSRVFMAIGGYTMQGLRKGMESASGKAIAIAGKIAKRISAVGTPQMAFAGYSGQPRQGARSLAQTNRATRAGDFNMGGVTIKIYAHPSMSAEDIGREVRREMNNLHREQKMRAKASYLDRD